MKVVYNDETYFIGFEYSVNPFAGTDQVDPETGVPPHIGRFTTAYVKKADSDFLVADTAFCTVYDPFVKETGRKIALTRVLSQFEDKNFRREVWKAYASQTKKQWKTKRSN